MPSSAVHRFVAATVVGATVAHHEKRQSAVTLKPIVAGGLAATFSNLPDRLEPAIHPNHRQFFHSVSAAMLMAYAGYKIYEWKPTEDWQKVARFVLLIGCSAYVLHLAADSVTSKSLPLMGHR